MLEETLYTPEEIAQKLKLSKYTIYEMIKRGDLDAHRLGRRLRISEQQLQSYIHRSQLQENTFTAAIINRDGSKYARLLSATKEVLFSVCTDLEGTVKVTIRPEDIILSHTRLICSARNIHHGIVTQLEATSNSMLLTIDIGVPLKTAITRQSVQEMDIKLGDELFAIFKTMAVQVN